MDKIRLIYDGDCPFCSRCAALVRFRQAAGDVAILNARGHPEVVREMQAKGYDLDKGMALTVNDRIYHGAEAINQIALMSTRSGLFNVFTAAVFRSKILSRVFYPILRVARAVALTLKGKHKINRAP